MTILKLFFPWFFIRPKPGETWVFKGTKRGPWEHARRKEVSIIDVKCGWVRYYMNSMFPDERVEVCDFICMYDPANPEVK